MIDVYIGFGSNLDNPLEQLFKAKKALKNHKCLKEIQASSIYKTPPWGFPYQNDFLNAVIKYGCEEDFSASMLLDLLQTQEREQKRKRDFLYAPRTLDLDILLYGDLVINNEKLTIPHPLIKDRGFVLMPLLEIAPNLEIKGQGIVKDLADKCDKMGIKKLSTIRWSY